MHVLSNESIDDILNHRALFGKDDVNNSRLKQYKILEKKFISSKKYSDNLSFLKDSEIKIRQIFGDSLKKHVDRLEELLLRANQLNFTKKRIHKEEISTLIDDENFKSAAIQVSDKYGNYGIVGFYSLNLQNRKLTNFTFSCRILNLGVEQFLY